MAEEQIIPQDILDDANHYCTKEDVVDGDKYAWDIANDAYVQGRIDERKIINEKLLLLEKYKENVEASKDLWDSLYA